MKLPKNMVKYSHHSLSGCDSMPKLYDWKEDSHKALKRSLSFSSLEDTAASLGNVYAKSTKLIPSYYGIKNMNNLSEVRFSVWGKQSGKELTSTPKSEFLPPTKKDFQLKVLRAHYQVCIWNSCLQPRHLEMDLCHVKCLIIELSSVLLFVWIFGFSHLFA